MENPLTMEKVLEELADIYKTFHKKPLPDGIPTAINRMMPLAQESPAHAQELEKFCKEMIQRKLVKVTSCNVPPLVLPTGYSATLNDVRVNARGPDDKLYKTNPDMRKWVPRGTTTMQLTGPESWFDVVLYANKKFTGGVGDEDENQPENDEIWREYCLEPPENAEQIVCMEKLNGEAGHFAGRYINGTFFIITGSKNTHMLIRNMNDIELYKEDRFQVARTVAKAVVEAVEGLSTRSRHVLFSLLHLTKATAICELLQPDYQHIVNLSHLEKPLVKFIAFTPTAGGYEETTLTAFPPHHILDLVRALGFSSTSFTIIEPECMMEQRDKIRADVHKEGEVLYYINKEGETFGIAKAKSVWYILLRALREKAVYTFTTAKRSPDWRLQDRIKSVYKRFKQIQSWLKLTPSCLKSWEVLAESFMNWLNKEIKGSRLEGSSIRPQFPILWGRFLAETGKDDKIPL